MRYFNVCLLAFPTLGPKASILICALGVIRANYLKMYFVKALSMPSKHDQYTEFFQVGLPVLTEVMNIWSTWCEFVQGKRRIHVFLAFIPD